MSVFKPDVPEVAYRFHVATPPPSFHQGADLSFVWYRGVENCLWAFRRGMAVYAQCGAHSSVEPLVRAWFLGDCIPGIVADFIEERGEGEEWLLRLLRDDDKWHESLLRPDLIIIDDAAQNVSLRSWAYRPTEADRAMGLYRPDTTS